MTTTDMRVTEYMGLMEKKCYDIAFCLVNKVHDFTGIHDLSGKFCYDSFFRKTHARLYLKKSLEKVPQRTNEVFIQTKLFGLDKIHKIIHSRFKN